MDVVVGCCFSWICTNLIDLKICDFCCRCCCCCSFLLNLVVAVVVVVDVVVVVGAVDDDDLVGLLSLKRDIIVGVISQ